MVWDHVGALCLSARGKENKPGLTWVKLSQVDRKFGFHEFFDRFGLNMTHYIIVDKL